MPLPAFLESVEHYFIIVHQTHTYASFYFFALVFHALNIYNAANSGNAGMMIS